ncbi:TPR repeat-containing thioredoxin TDX [Arachis hypogaea]|nr:TPR repeat-containing thioredoxin TDX [Arachis hypogaea]
MESGKILELRQLIEACKSNPSFIHDPSLSFFKSYLLSLGARIPPNPKTEPVDVDDIVESDIDLDDSDLVEPDNDPPLKMGDPSAQVTPDMIDAAQLAKSRAIDYISQNKLDQAVEQLTEAILLNPHSAILYATRASVLLKLKKPNAAVRDADTALKINQDSAKGYKVRGMARAMLGLWEEAASDLHVASKLDYDEDIGMALKKVEPNVRKIEDHRRKYERLRKHKEEKRAELKKQEAAEAQVQEALSALKDGMSLYFHLLDVIKIPKIFCFTCLIAFLHTLPAVLIIKLDSFNLHIASVCLHTYITALESFSDSICQNGTFMMMGMAP